MSVNSRSRASCAGRIAGNSGVARVSAIPIRIDGSDATGATIGARIVIAAGAVIGILDAVEKPPRSDGLALLVARVAAIAQSWRVIALQTKRIARADRLGRRGAQDRQSARGQQRKS